MKQRASRMLLALVAAACASALPIAAAAQTPAASAQSAPANALPAASPRTPLPPSDLYGPLYRDVELAPVFADSKTFADMPPNEPPAQIVAAYKNFQKENAKTTDPAARKAALTQFVNRYFSPPTHAESNYVSDPNQDVVAHIDTLWNVLLRQPDSNAKPDSSLRCRCRVRMSFQAAASTRSITGTRGSSCSASKRAAAPNSRATRSRTSRR